MISIPDISQTYPKESLTLDSRFVVGEGNARDLSSDANTGTLVTGRALSLDGTADYLNCGTGIDVTSSGSISIWAKAASVSGGDQIILETTDSGNRFAVQMTGATFQVSWYPSATYRGVASSSVSADTWYHIVGTVDDSDNTALYINGVAQSGSYSTIGTSGTNVTAIGTRLSSADRLFTGSLSCAKVFNVELTAAQALELYSNPEQVLPTGVAAANLKRYYPLSDYGHPRQATVDSDSDGDYTDEATSQNGLYFMDLGADKVNALAYNGHMSVAEQSPCPQLGLMPSSSLLYFPNDRGICHDAQTHFYTADFTMSLWVFLQDGDSQQFLFESGGYNGGSPYAGSQRYALQIFGGGGAQKLIWHHDDNGSTDTVSYDRNSTFPVGEWLHIGVSFKSSDGSIQLFYEGTKQSGSSSGNGGDGADLAFGGRYMSGSGTSGSYLQGGYIANVGFWNEVLDDDEFAALHTAGVSHDYRNASGNYDSQSSLTGYYQMDNAYNTTDIVGSYPDLNNDSGDGRMVLSVFPEGATPGETAAGFTREKRADNAVINLDGHSYVTIPHDVNLNPDVSEGFTVSVWVKYRGLGSGASTPVLDKDEGNDRWHLRIRDDSTDIYQLNFGDGTSTTDVGGNAIADNDWHHIVYTLASDGSDWTTATYYRDGASVSTTDISARDADTPGTDALTIGSIGTTASLDGAVAYPKIYARVLAANEIKLLYSSGLRVVGGL